MCPNTKVNRTPLAAAIAILLCVSSATLADPPPGYYNSVDATNSTTLRTTLHAVIDDHTRFPCASSNTDTWDILNLADEDPNDVASFGLLRAHSGFVTWA